jgi:hypothetical protein
MAGRQRGGHEPGAGQPEPEGLVELLSDLDRPGAWMLLVDGVPQSHVDLGDPWHLELEYMRHLGHLIDLAAPPGSPLRVLHLAADPFPARVVAGGALDRFAAESTPIMDRDAKPSPAPPPEVFA